ILEQLQSDGLECGRHRGDLGEDVDAVAIVLDHPLDPAHLPFDPVQALHDRGLVVVVSRRGHVRTLSKRRRRRLFPTTKRLEQATAAAATIGVASPATASGRAATLYAKAQNRLPSI